MAADSDTSEKASADELQKLFNLFDKKKQGYLDKEDFVQVLKSKGQPMTDAEINDMFGTTDLNDDGKIDLTEFLIMNGVQPIRKNRGTAAAPRYVPGSSEEEESDDEEPPEGFFTEQPTYARQSVSAEAYGDWNKKQDFTPPVIAKSAEQTARLQTVMSKSFLFTNLEQKDMSLVIGAMQEKPAKAGECLIKQGDEGDCLYVVESGELDCSMNDKVVKTCSEGDAFGELALLYNCPRAASVVSRTDSILWQLDRKTFQHIVADAAQQKRNRYEAFLEKTWVGADMSKYERAQLADVLKAETFEDGVTVVKQGDEGNKFYIIEEGSLVATKNGVDEVKAYSAGEYFGELALLRNQPRAATVTCRGPAKVLSVDSKSFKRLLNISELEKKAADYKE